MNKNWKSNKIFFDVVDARKMSGNFLPAILKKVEQISLYEGICVIQSFEPIPLYSILEKMGFEKDCEKVSDTEYHAYFYKTKEQGDSTQSPLKPTAILNFKEIDDSLADVVVNFWKEIWEKENCAIDRKTKLLLSLTNGVGAGRYRQATRELVKAYSFGVTVEELDELFALLAWNHGVGTFASEIGPSSLFGAYQMIKSMEKKGATRVDVANELIEKFGENNSDVSTFYTVQN